MSTLFLIGIVAVVVGAIALVADGALDFIPDSEWFSLTGIAAGVAMFGFTAGILEGIGLPLSIALVVGGAAGLGVIVLVSWLIYKLRNFSSGGVDSSINSLVGSIGTVITPIPASGTGEVDVRFGGERHRFNAVSEDDIPATAQVSIVGIVSPTCVRVVHLR
jgi:membrane protein implicated in regulation of membrane protease activity